MSRVKYITNFQKSIFGNFLKIGNFDFVLLYQTIAINLNQYPICHQPNPCGKNVFKYCLNESFNIWKKNDNNVENDIYWILAILSKIYKGLLG